MKKETPFLDFYHKCMETETMPTSGLCHAFSNYYLNNIVAQFKPTLEDREQLQSEGLPTMFWGRGVSYADNRKASFFSPLRQNIVLLCAAINGEL